MCNGHPSPALHITQSTLHSREGQAITEYLLLWVAVVIAVALVVGSAKAKATLVAQRELDHINDIPSQ